MNVANEWRKALEKEGYAHHVSSRADCRELKKFSRIWRRIFGLIGLGNPCRNDLAVFEVGCGGGKHLVKFAVCGSKCAGIDGSPEVLERAENYAEEAKKVCGANPAIKFIQGDFLEYHVPENVSYDLVFHVGVLEHFLDEKERILATQKMFDLTKPGGFVVSIVPAGTHPLRQKMKELKLGGYGIPEIDYNPEIINGDLKRCGGEKVMTMPHNIFGYLLLEENKGLAQKLKRIFYYLFQIIPPQILPYDFAVRHASTLIGIAQKKTL